MTLVIASTNDDQISLVADTKLKKNEDETRCEGFWSAAAHTVRQGGHIAIICESGDAAVHAAINDAAINAGMGYEQHVLACSPEALDNAVTYEFAASRRHTRQTHARAHVDVFVYTRRCFSGVQDDV